MARNGRAIAPKRAATAASSSPSRSLKPGLKAMKARGRGSAMRATLAERPARAGRSPATAWVRRAPKEWPEKPIASPRSRAQAPPAAWRRSTSSMAKCASAMRARYCSAPAAWRAPRRPDCQMLLSLPGCCRCSTASPAACQASPHTAPPARLPPRPWEWITRPQGPSPAGQRSAHRQFALARRVQPGLVLEGRGRRSPGRAGAQAGARAAASRSRRFMAADSGAISAKGPLESTASAPRSPAAPFLTRHVEPRTSSPDPRSRRAGLARRSTCRRSSPNCRPSTPRCPMPTCAPRPRPRTPAAAPRKRCPRRASSPSRASPRACCR